MPSEPSFTAHVILGLELNPGIAHRFNPALIRGLFDRVGFLWPQDARRHNRTDGNDQPNYYEQANIDPLTHRISNVNYVLLHENCTIKDNRPPFKAYPF
jgi:hypothetical protein